MFVLTVELQALLVVPGRVVERLARVLLKREKRGRNTVRGGLDRLRELEGGLRERLPVRNRERSGRGPPLFERRRDLRERVEDALLDLRAVLDVRGADRLDLGDHRVRRLDETSQ